MPQETSKAQSFQLEEYKALRSEIDFYIAEFRSQERNAVIAVGFIWAWLISNHKTHMLLWGAPVVLVLAILIRSHAMGSHIGVISNYIKTIEQSFELQGWEQTPHHKGLGFMHNLLTWALLGLTIVGLALHSSLVQ